VKDINAILLMIAIVIAGGTGAFYVRNLLIKRAVSKVLGILRRHNALGEQGAKTLRELGLERPSFMQKAVSRKDYKQDALQILVKQGIVRVNANGTAYLTEEIPTDA
jgi:hypothetical protein